MNGAVLRATALAAALLLLGACASVPRAPAPAPPPTAPAPATATSIQASLRCRRSWSMRRRGRACARASPCPAATMRSGAARGAALHAFAEDFTASWKSALPFLLLVLVEIEKRDLPGELAVLPYVESHSPTTAGTGQPPGRHARRERHCA
ncbi:MAG: hypothetical protein KIS84_10450 [Dokdonella sp.]|nr:hypothetical protein [Dokdonella sp.]